jgi:hypothetical protein
LHIQGTRPSEREGLKERDYVAFHAGLRFDFSPAGDAGFFMIFGGLSALVRGVEGR